MRGDHLIRPFHIRMKVLIALFYLLVGSTQLIVEVHGQDNGAEDTTVPVSEVTGRFLNNIPIDEELIETTVFDLYLSDNFQGSILVRYTEDWFEIDDPRDIADQF